MKVVHKFELEFGFGKGIQLREGSKVVHFGFQGQIPFIWVELDPSVTVMVMRVFLVVGTGYQLSDDNTYIGTAQTPGYVWHCYEEPVA